MIKQYVNLDSDPDHPHHGPRLELTAQASQITDEDSVRSDWWIEGQGQNQPRRFLSHAARAHFEHGHPRNEGDHFNNVLHLPHVGGDAYDTYCSKRNDRDNHHSFETIETWRKIYFSVWFMNDTCQSLFNQSLALVNTQLRRVFVELEEVDRHRTRVEEDATTYHNVMRHLYQDPESPEASALQHRPFHLRVVAINRLNNPANRNYSGSTSETSYTQTSVHNLPETGWLASGRIRFNRRGASWQSVQESDEFMVRVDATHFRCDASSIPGFWDEPEFETWQYEFHTNELNGLVGGQVGNLSIICRYDGDRVLTSQDLAQAQIHEMGHAFGQVVRRERTYNGRGAASGWARHPSWHNNRHGGLGNHCSHNARLESNSTTSSGQIYEPVSGQTVCVMFHHLLEEPVHDYCANCLSRTQRANLGRQSMISRRWNRF